MPKHKLLTKAILKEFPEWRSTDGKPPEEIKIIAKFFTPFSNWTWYAVEFDGEDTFFGFVCGHENELGYFSLNELQELRNEPLPKIERDLYFGDKTLADVYRIEKKEVWRG